MEGCKYTNASIILSKNTRKPLLSGLKFGVAGSNHGLEIRSPTAFKFPTVGGIMAPAAHGTGNATRTFSDYVISFSIVDGFGNLHTNITTEDDI